MYSKHILTVKSNFKDILLDVNVLIKDLIEGNYFDYVWQFYDEYFWKYRSTSLNDLKFVLLYSKYLAIRIAYGKNIIKNDQIGIELDKMVYNTTNGSGTIYRCNLEELFEILQKYVNKVDPEIKLNTFEQNTYGTVIIDNFENVFMIENIEPRNILLEE